MFSINNARVPSLRDERYTRMQQPVVNEVQQRRGPNVFLEEPSPRNTQQQDVHGGKGGVGRLAGNGSCGFLKGLFDSIMNSMNPRKNSVVSQPSRAPVPAVPPVVLSDASQSRTDKTAHPIPGLSNKSTGDMADNIWSGFHQGQKSNCVTVSAIKAAMAKFGQHPASIFAHVEKTTSGYHVSMRDGYQLTLTDRELAQAVQGANFVGHEAGMLKDAQFLFAVSAKRAQMENNDGWAAISFKAAIGSLNDGEDEQYPGEGLLRLGLKDHIKLASVHELARGQLGMLNRSRHSVAVINGHEELWGDKGEKPRHGDAIALI